MEKVLKNKFLLEVSAFMLLLYSTTIFVHLNGDDFMYGTFAHNGIFANVWDYYHTGNGRFWINIVDSTLLRFDRYLYIVVLPLIVLAFVILIAKNVQFLVSGYSDQRKERQLIRIGMVLFACLDIMCLRETVYWITGMMNYLFPAVVFLYAYYLFQRLRVGALSKRYYLFYYGICFLAASSVEQFALMFVGMMTLQHIYDLIKKRHIPIYEWGAYLVAILGLALLLFAPGNFVRIDTQGAIKPSFIDNCWTLVYQNTFSHVALPLFLMLSIEVFVLFNKHALKWGWIFPIVIVVSSAISFLEKAILFAFLLLIFAVRFIIVLNSKEEINNYNFFALCFVGIGSQVMLLVSAIWGFRCMFSMYLVYMLLICVCLYNQGIIEISFVLFSGITVAMSPWITIIYWVLCLLVKKVAGIQKNVFVNFHRLALPICVVVVMLSISIGYAKNNCIIQKNIIASKSKENSITINELMDDTYSWYFVPFGDFHENYYKQYHCIENTEINYVYSE